MLRAQNGRKHRKNFFSPNCEACVLVNCSNTNKIKRKYQIIALDVLTRSVNVGDKDPVSVNPTMLFTRSSYSRTIRRFRKIFWFWSNPSTLRTFKKWVNVETRQIIFEEHFANGRIESCGRWSCGKICYLKVVHSTPSSCRMEQRDAVSRIR